MNTIGLDFVVIKGPRACLNDHRGCQSGFFWSDVQQVIEYVDVNSRATSVKVKFRNDHKGTYTLIFEMTLDKFLEQLEKQLNHPPRLYADGDEFPPPSNHNEILIFNIDGIKVKLSREDIWRAEQTCIGSCYLSSYCPFFGKPSIEVGAGCRRIFDAYDAGQYAVSNGIFKEDDE